MVVRAKLFTKLLEMNKSPDQFAAVPAALLSLAQIVFHRGFFNFLAVDGELLVQIRHGIPGQTHHPLDVIHIGLGRIAKYHDITALHWTAIGDFRVDDG